MVKALEYVTVNDGLDYWKIDYELGKAELIEDSAEAYAWLESVGRKRIKELDEDVGSYLSFQGLRVIEHETAWSFSFG